MEIEQLEIRDYIAQCAPLNKLPDDELNRVVHALEISYSRSGEELLSLGESNHTLFLIRSGALAVTDGEGNIRGQYGEGDWVGYRSLLNDGEVTLAISAVEDTLLYRVPGNVFLQLFRQYDFVSEYFSQQKPQRLRSAIEDIRDSGNRTLISNTVSELVHGQPLLVEENDSVQSVAKAMQKAGYTIALVMNQKKLTGIVTDRAYCTKVVANNLSLDLSVKEIMTERPLTLNADCSGSDALLMMAKHNIRHIPVTREEQIVGVITATDLIRQQSHNSIYLINEINRSGSVAELVILARQIPNTLMNLVENSLTANDIGRLISSIGVAINRQMIKIVQQEIGEAPIGFAWIVAGSMARNEQTAISDQDNGIILSDDYNEEEHAEYFIKLSGKVCDGLNDCGYVYCPGNVMASNEKWRQPAKIWKAYFNKWIDEPEPMALMQSSIFFDLRCVFGDEELLAEVREPVLNKTKDNSIFLGLLAANALKFRPPIGLFRNFVMENNGHEEKALNMKKRGLTPIVDLARVYALSAGLTEINTQQRLLAASEAGVLSHDGMNDLKDALEFISTVRLQHQMLQAKKSLPIDNYVFPEILSTLERRHLKDAFDVVRTMQAVLEQRY